MSTREASAADEPIIESIEDLIAPMRKGEKPKDQWRIGTEHEKLVYRRLPEGQTHGKRPAPSYDEPCGIRDLLMNLRSFGWEPIEENGHVIAMKGADGTVSLEPAGQLELSGAPLETLHETCNETGRHLAQVKEIGEKCGVGYLGLGMWPDKTREELPVMPKGRYKIMMNHMPKVGNLGLDMMLRTCTIQVNLDYSSEADMVQKFRVGLALQPLATALFANSPFTEGKPNGYLSYRSHIWSDTDPHRTGMLPFVFEDGFGYERWAEYMLDVPMYFVFRDGKYIDAAGLSFRDFIDGKLSVLPGERPTASDWWDHLSTAFPKCASKASSKCAAPMAARGAAFARSPHFGLACFTIRVRSMRHGIWSRIGRWKSARGCAMTHPASHSTRRYPAAGRCRIWGAKCLPSRTRGWLPAASSMPAVTTKRAISKRSTRSSPAGKFPPSACLMPITASGARTFRKCTATRSKTGASGGEKQC